MRRISQLVVLVITNYLPLLVTTDCICWNIWLSSSRLVFLFSPGWLWCWECWLGLAVVVAGLTADIRTGGVFTFTFTRLLLGLGLLRLVWRVRVGRGRAWSPTWQGRLCWDPPWEAKLTFLLSCISVRLWLWLWL